MTTTDRTDKPVSSGAGRRHGGSKDMSQRLSLIAIRKMGDSGLLEERLTLIRVDEILYLFTAGALSPPRTVIDAKWQDWKLFSPGRVYLRTAQGLFVTRYRTLAKILDRLDQQQMIRLQKSLALNATKIKEVDLAPTKLKRVSVVANGATEWLTVSRRSLKKLRLALGL